LTVSADFLAIGHVARDEFEGEATWRLGGTALYAAATAARFGTRAALVTRVGPAEKAALEERCAQLGIALRALPSSATTTFGFRYVDGRRFMRLKARARGISPSDLPPEWRQARAVVGATERQRWIAVTVATQGEVARLRGEQGRARALFEQAREHYLAGGAEDGAAAIDGRLQSLAKDRQRPRKVAARRTAGTATNKRRQS